MVNEVTTHFMKRGAAVNAYFLDCGKAFDKCKFDHRRIWGHNLGGAHIQARMSKSGPDCNKNKTPRLML